MILWDILNEKYVRNSFGFLVILLVGDIFLIIDSVLVAHLAEGLANWASLEFEMSSSNLLGLIVTLFWLDCIGPGLRNAPAPFTLNPWRGWIGLGPGPKHMGNGRSHIRPNGHEC